LPRNDRALSEYRARRPARRVSSQVIASALAGITRASGGDGLDRRQRYAVRKSFEEYARTGVTERASRQL
jgi:hypothetical protein